MVQIRQPLASRVPFVWRAWCCLRLVLSAPTSMMREDRERRKERGGYGEQRAGEGKTRPAMASTLANGVERETTAFESRMAVDARSSPELLSPVSRSVSTSPPSGSCHTSPTRPPLAGMAQPGAGHRTGVASKDVPTDPEAVCYVCRRCMLELWWMRNRIRLNVVEQRGPCVEQYSVCYRYIPAQSPS